MDNMDDYREDDGKIKKPKEYYQINLDMGRIFWIVFILGLVVIGIFVLGFYIGGGSRKSAGLFGNGKKSVEELASSGEKVANKVKSTDGEGKEGLKEKTSGKVSDEVSIEDLFKNSEVIDTGEEEKEGIGISTGKRSVTAGETRTASKTYTSLKEKKSTQSVKKSVRKITGNYYIQVASFKNKNNALSLKSKLEKDLYKVKIEEKIINGVKYYRVRVGPFSSKSVAKNTMIAMKRRYKLESPFVVVKK